MLPGYPHGQIKQARQAFVTVGNQTFVEPVLYVVGLLSEFFDESHVLEPGSSVKTVIIDDHRHVQVGDTQMADYVLVYPIDPGSSKPITIGYSYKKEIIRLAIRIVSGARIGDGHGGRPDERHYLKLVKEVERVIDLRRRRFLFDPYMPSPTGTQTNNGPSWAEFAPSIKPRDMETPGIMDREYTLTIHRPFQLINTDRGGV